MHISKDSLSEVIFSSGNCSLLLHCLLSPLKGDNLVQEFQMLLNCLQLTLYLAQEGEEMYGLDYSCVSILADCSIADSHTRPATIKNYK